MTTIGFGKRLFAPYNSLLLHNFIPSEIQLAKKRKSSYARGHHHHTGGPIRIPRAISPPGAASLVPLTNQVSFFIHFTLVNFRNSTFLAPIFPSSTSTSPHQFPNSRHHQSSISSSPSNHVGFSSLLKLLEVQAVIVSTPVLPFKPTV